MSRDHAGWRTRGYLPHFDEAGVIQHIVFRLADSLPTDVLARVETAPPPDRAEAASTALDAGFGSGALANPHVAALVRDALVRFDGVQYRLIAWCVMPTHVHILAEQAKGWPLAVVVQGWKSVTARRANNLLGRRGAFWAREYFDRAIRDERHFESTWNYILANPVIAGLCAVPEDWPWSSVARN